MYHQSQSTIRSKSMEIRNGILLFLIMFIGTNSVFGLVNVKIDSERRICVNDTPFFPIGIYSVPADSMASVKDLGFNVVHNYMAEGSPDVPGTAGAAAVVKAYLDKADSLGIKAFIGLPRYDVVNYDSVSLIERIRLLQSSPGLLVWYLFDEPQWQGVPADVLLASSLLIKQYDAGVRPTVVVHCLVKDQQDVFMENMDYFNCANIIMTDPYPVTEPFSDLQNVYNEINVAQQIAGNKPVWNVIQLHGAGSGGAGYGLLEPTYEQVRNMVYQSLTAGVKGLTFWGYHCSQFSLFKSPQGLLNTKKITTEIHTLSPILLSNTPTDTLLSISSNSDLRTREFHYQNRIYLFAVNTIYSATDITVKSRSGSWTSVKRLTDNTELNIDGDSLSESIEPLGVRIYEIVSQDTGGTSIEASRHVPLFLGPTAAPNPFFAATQVTFNVPQAKKNEMQKVSVRVYDLSGQSGSNTCAGFFYIRMSHSYIHRQEEREWAYAWQWHLFLPYAGAWV